MKEEILNELEKNTGALIELISSLPQEQLNKIPFEGSWTAAQLGDHLLKSYAVVETLNGPVKKTERPMGEKIEQVKTLFLNFDIKMNSPEAVIPSNGPIDKEKLLSALRNRIEQLNGIIQTKNLSETCLGFAIPQYGEFTRLEWIYFTIYHTQRHVHQLKNIVSVIKGEK